MTTHTLTKSASRVHRALAYVEVDGAIDPEAREAICRELLSCTAVEFCLRYADGRYDDPFGPEGVVSEHVLTVLTYFPEFS